MIQRIQSVYLLLVAIVIALCFFFPFYSVDLVGSELVADSMKGQLIAQGIVLSESNHPYVMILCIISILISVAAIFLYGNRTIQLRITRLGILINTGLLVAVFFALEEVKALHPGLEIEIGQYGLSCYLPIVAMVLGFLATRGILKDEMLVRSSNRLR